MGGRHEYRIRLRVNAADDRKPIKHGQPKRSLAVHPPEKKNRCPNTEAESLRVGAGFQRIAELEGKRGKNERSEQGPAQAEPPGKKKNSATGRNAEQGGRQTGRGARFAEPTNQREADEVAEGRTACI